MLALKNIWINLASKYSNDSECIEKLWVEIVEKYSFAGRYYHNLSHIEYIMEKVEAFKEKIKDIDSVMFSVFYHDIIYDVSNRDNEVRSAEVVLEHLRNLGVPKDIIYKTFYQIIQTRNHTGDNDYDTNLFLDFDLAILGDTPQKYSNYATNVRKEYSMYPDSQYNEGRKKVLEHFLSMDTIFKTDEFKKSHEQLARVNLTLELKSLL